MQSVEEKNAKKRLKRLGERKERFKDKHCLNCDIFISERLIDKGRSYLYCRKCLTEYKDEARRNRWRRYYERNREKLLPKMRERTRLWYLNKHGNSTTKETS